MVAEEAIEAPTVAAVTCRVLTTPAELVALAPAWQELLDDSVRPELMLTPDWLLTWWRVYGKDRALAVGAFYAGDRLVGLAPMCRRTYRYRPGLPFQRLEWLGADVDEGDGVCSDWLHLIVRPGFEAMVCERFVSDVVAGRFGRWHEWVLSAADGDHPLTPLLKDAWSRAGFAVRETRTNDAPFLVLPESWDAFLKPLSKKRRQSFVYSVRDFERWAEGTEQLHEATDAESLARGKAILIDLHRERWQAEGGTGVFESPRFVAFHDAFLRDALQAGRLKLQWLTVRGEPVAVHYSFLYADRLYYYQTGRRSGTPANVRLGIVLLIYAMQGLMRDGVRELDFLAGPAQYKRLFTGAERPVVELRVARVGPREGLRRILRASLHRVRALRAWLRSGPASVNEGEQGL